MAATRGASMRNKNVLIKGGVAMKAPWKMILGLVLLAAVSAAQQAPKLNPASTNAGDSKNESRQATSAAKSELAQHATAMPDAKEQPRMLTEKEKRGISGNRLRVTP
jgi:hypothetical protein